MNIGIVVDGQAEAIALREIASRIVVPNRSIMNPVYADMQPRATPAQIARSAKSKIDLLLARGADRIIVLIDLEDSDSCPGDFADDLRTTFAKLVVGVEVVVKVRCFENWLIADPSAFKAMRSRFKVTRKFEMAVSPNKADRHSVKQASTLIDSIAQKSEYHKRKDAVSIGARLDIDAAARNSRSFRKLLNCLGYPNYDDQSINPI